MIIARITIAYFQILLGWLGVFLMALSFNGFAAGVFSITVLLGFLVLLTGNRITQLISIILCLLSYTYILHVLGFPITLTVVYFVAFAVIFSGYFHQTIKYPKLLVISRVVCLLLISGSIIVISQIYSLVIYCIPLIVLAILWIGYSDHFDKPIVKKKVEFTVRLMCALLLLSVIIKQLLFSLSVQYTDNVHEARREARQDHTNAYLDKERDNILGDLYLDVSVTISPEAKSDEDVRFEINLINQSNDRTYHMLLGSKFWINLKVDYGKGRWTNVSTYHTKYGVCPMSAKGCKEPVTSSVVFSNELSKLSSDEETVLKPKKSHNILSKDYNLLDPYGGNNLLPGKYRLYIFYNTYMDLPNVNQYLNEYAEIRAVFVSEQIEFELK